MIVGVPKEIKTDEYRVGLIPPVVLELVSRGHKVAIQTGSGRGAGISDEEYAAAGANILPTADQVFEEADLIVKVKEPLPPERKKLRRGQVVDVSIDQGGCAETSRPTTHSEPTYVVDGVIHYCVANMPGAVPRTSTFALSNATRPFVLALADKGFPSALIEDAHLRNGLNIHEGNVTCRAVADALGLPCTPPAGSLVA